MGVPGVGKTGFPNCACELVGAVGGRYPVASVTAAAACIAATFRIASKVTKSGCKGDCNMVLGTVGDKQGSLPEDSNGATLGATLSGLGGI